MADDLGDARSRGENRRLWAMAMRTKSGDPVFATAPRRVPQSTWWVFPADAPGSGVGLILMVLGMRLLGVVGG